MCYKEEDCVTNFNRPVQLGAYALLREQYLASLIMESAIYSPYPTLPRREHILVAASDPLCLVQNNIRKELFCS